MLILGALSGIQKYIFDVPEAGGGQARRLRGRSFFVQVLAEAAMLRLLRSLKRPIDVSSDLLLSHASKFTLWVPDESGASERVVSGHETHFNQLNPWDALGYQVVEEAVAVFNNGGYAAAGVLLEKARGNISSPSVKREISTLKALVDAYAAWDRFDHKTAEQCFEDALKNRNDLLEIFPNAQSLLARLERHRDQAAQLANQNKNAPTTIWVEDLFRNAERRAAEHRFDDAVARLYRAFEALAQIRLREKHNIPDAKSVPLDRLPETLRSEWAGRARGGAVPLGLQDAYRLLKELGDKLGENFVEAGLDEQCSPLSARNRSILAHGFDPLGEKDYNSLRNKVLRLLVLAKKDDTWNLPSVLEASV
jgi:CRISPR-associated protein (TIGR02710 family)